MNIFIFQWVEFKVTLNNIVIVIIVWNSVFLFFIYLTTLICISWPMITKHEKIHSMCYDAGALYDLYPLCENYLFISEIQPDILKVILLWHIKLFVVRHDRVIVWYWGHVWMFCGPWWSTKFLFRHKGRTLQ